MIILVQSSYFIYQLVISLAASITNATITLIDPNFFLLGTGGFTDVGLSILFSLLYLGTLVISAFMLILRYAFVSIGVVLLPLAIFFYFIPALRQYGSLILNFLGTSIFIVILDAVLLTGFSKIVDISIFGELKIFVLITAFGLINWLMFFLMFFSIIKSCINVGTKIAGTVASVAKYFV
jgi:hypothetical protein